MSNNLALNIEQIKKEKSGIDVLGDIYIYSIFQERITANDLERFKWYGLYAQDEKQEFFELKIPLEMGELNLEQIETLSQISKNYANNSFVAQWNENDRVRNMVRDSGIDPDTGKKIRIEANVTQTANKAKVASTLVERLKKAKDFAKHAGKASIPAFVGGAAFQALMDGVGWVMDEGGEVRRIAEPNSSNSPGIYCVTDNQCNYSISFYAVAHQFLH